MESSYDFCKLKSTAGMGNKNNLCMCVVWLIEVSKPSLEISPICSILIKQGGYHLTLPVAQCCTVKNTASVLGAAVFLLYESVH
jgi:hypothetical protein